jgi:protein-S-isoprenylcysteine O-methyltransferase Ste14
MKLLISAITKMIFGIALNGAMLFLPAWTWSYFGAWLFIGVLFVPVLIMGAVLYVRAPALLEKRLKNREREGAQRGVVALSGIMFIATFIISSLDFRFGWSDAPSWVMILGAVLFLLGYAMFAEVTRENAYLSRTVEVDEGQQVVSTGLYGVVRHPMYAATLLMFLPLPLILGSFWGLCAFALYPVILVIRIRNEESVLREQLDGYADYLTKVKYRLIPFIW